ncbi:MAG: hypothetical protein J6Q69_02320 [Clostridia bacterium]|nr:hypothetical protein [Clostridia bacterium]
MTKNNNTCKINLANINDLVTLDSILRPELDRLRRLDSPLLSSSLTVKDTSAMLKYSFHAKDSELFRDPFVIRIEAVLKFKGDAAYLKIEFEEIFDERIYEYLKELHEDADAAVKDASDSLSKQKDFPSLAFLLGMEVEGHDLDIPSAMLKADYPHVGIWTIHHQLFETGSAIAIAKIKFDSIEALGCKIKELMQEFDDVEFVDSLTLRPWFQNRGE